MLHAAPRLTPRPRCRRARPLRPCAIGFGVGEASRNDRADARADRLLASASQLLILQPVLSGELPQAFLKTLAALRAGRDGGQAALIAYGAFYRLLAASEHGTWREALLSSLLGTTTVFSEKAAAGKLLPGSLQSAVAADLNRLSELCVKEGTLAGWVAEAAELRDSPGTAVWLSSSALELDSDDREQPTAARAVQGAPASGGDCGKLGLQLETDGVGGCEWEALAAFHARHGHGPAALHGVLAWTDGGLVAAEKWQAQELLLNRFLPGAGLVGFSSSTRALFIHEAFSSTPVEHSLGTTLRTEPALRAVLLPKGELRSLPALLAALRRHPSTRFAVLVRDVSLVPFSESHSVLLTTLRSAREAVPDNVALAVFAMQEGLLRKDGKEALAAEGGALEAAFEMAPQLCAGAFDPK